MTSNNLQKSIYNFIKTVECQRYITNESVEEYVNSHTLSKYPNKNLNSVWISCNQHFDSGIYVYLHRYQKLIRKNFSKNIDIKIIDTIENNTNKIYDIYKDCTNKEQFLMNYKVSALNGTLDKLISKGI